MNTFLLRDIPLQYVALVEEYNAEETTDERREAIESLLLMLDDNFAVLCQHLASLRASYEASAMAYHHEMDRLDDLAFRARRKAEWLEGYIAQCLKAKGLNELKTELYKFTFRKSSAVIVTNEATIPEEFKRHIPEKWEPDKKLIKDAIAKGGIVEGAYVDERSNLHIK